MIFRGDSGFCRPLGCCPGASATTSVYVVGMAKNSSAAHAGRVVARASCPAPLPGPGKRSASSANSPTAPRSWPCHRRLIAKAEHNAQGANPRFVVTNAAATTRKRLYEQMYCARGDMENRIKECQLGLFADRTSCHLWWPNQFRLMLASACLRVAWNDCAPSAWPAPSSRALKSGILRCRLLKVGAVIVRNTRRIRFFLASAFPHQAAFLLAAQRFATG